MHRIFTIVCILLATTASSNIRFKNIGDYSEGTMIDENVQVQLNALESYTFSNNFNFALFSCKVIKIESESLNPEARDIYKSADDNLIVYDNYIVYTRDYDDPTEGKTVTFAIPLGVSVNVGNISENDVTLQCKMRLIPYPTKNIN